MRYLISLFAALCFVCLCHARPPQAPPVRARAALALARPPQAPPVKYACQCEEPDDAKCKCHGSCGCYGAGHRPPQAPPCCEPLLNQEQQWRAEGWQQDAAGQWFRVVGPASPLVTPAGYSAPVPLAPAFYPAPAFFGGGLGGCVGGG